jgi:hypothetical protein
MPISSGKTFKIECGGIRFSLKCGTKLISALVTHEALHDMSDSVFADDLLQAPLEVDWERIESIVKMKVHDGEYLPDGSIRIGADDIYRLTKNA